MDVRKKLVELLAGCPCESDCEGKLGSCPNRKNGNCNEIFRLSYCAVSKLADYLIAHGITVQEKKRFLLKENGDLIPLDQGWISVKDRLPETFKDVLVFRNGKVAVDHHEENGWFAYDFKGRRATHWMPLPPAPKGE